MSLRAVSLAFLSLALGSHDIQRRARYRYTSALHLTSAALQSSHFATHNATLLTVFLLYLYEKLVGHSVHDASGEPKHLNGALTLLQISSASQFGDTIRLGLFRQLSMSIFLRCLGNGDDVPPALLALRQTAGAADQDGCLEKLMAEFVELRSRLCRGEIQKFKAYEAVQQLDDTLVSHSPRPPGWKFADAIRGDIADKELFIHLLEVGSIEQ
jgi:hypothetical protein